jgi:protein-S-isoprenylcysteine O-methyltransferase Ste14
VRADFSSTSTRTFVLYPVVLGLWQAARRRSLDWRWAPLLAWGYLQYHLAGRYRTAHGGGGPGMSNPPERLVTRGIYSVTRNPMYLGHLLFLAGLAFMTRSRLAGVLFCVHLPWFDARVRHDEAGLSGLFGAEYDAYRHRVPRWLPGRRRPQGGTSSKWSLSHGT